MAVQVRISRNQAGIIQLLKSSEVKADLNRRANAILAVAGEGFAVSEWENSDRAVASVRTSDIEGRKRQAEENVLIIALDAGR